MSFGVQNTPAASQRLMQTVLRDLNPESEPDFVSVYLDDILVYSRTLEEHLHHLQLVIEQDSNSNQKSAFFSVKRLNT